MCDQISLQVSERLLLRFVDVSSLLGSVSGDRWWFTFSLSYRSWLSFDRGASTSEINELHSLIIHRWCFHVLNVLPPRLHPLSINVWLSSGALFKNRRSLLFCDVTAPRDSDSTKQERKEKADSSEAEPGKTDNEKNSAAAVFSFKGILFNF